MPTSKRKKKSSIGARAPLSSMTRPCFRCKKEFTVSYDSGIADKVQAMIAAEKELEQLLDACDHPGFDMSKLVYQKDDS